MRLRNPAEGSFPNPQHIHKDRKGIDNPIYRFRDLTRIVNSHDVEWPR